MAAGRLPVGHGSGSGIVHSVRGSRCPRSRPGGLGRRSARRSCPVTGCSCVSPAPRPSSCDAQCPPVVPSLGAPDGTDEARRGKESRRAWPRRRRGMVPGTGSTVSERHPMTWNDRPPFRADHVGSLLRPPALLEARSPVRRRGDRRGRAARGRGPVRRRGRRAAAGRRAADGHGRRVPTYLVAHGLHLPARGRRQHRREAAGALPQRRRRPGLRVRGARRCTTGSRSATRSSATRSRSCARRCGRPPTA